MRQLRYEKVAGRWCFVDVTTRADREHKAGWTTPYATDPKCDHARGAVEVTPPFQQPPLDWSKPLGGFVIRMREWACADCGHPVNVHAYLWSQCQPLPDDARRASTTMQPPVNAGSAA